MSACFAQVKVPWFIPSVSQLQLHLLHVYLKTLLLSTSQCSKFFKHAWGQRFQHALLRSKCRGSFRQSANCSCISFMSI